MRLATFNVLHGRSLADDRVDKERFAEAIASLDADVLHSKRSTGAKSARTAST